MTDMDIKRIGFSSQPSSTGRQAQPRTDARTTDLTRIDTPVRARLGDNRAPQGFRPVAGFLAQYVAQHAPRPRAASGKDGRRRRATRAYIEADMLPDLLAETLRLRTVDRRY